MHQIQNGAPVPLFDDRAQEEIIALAAQLQRQEGQAMSLSELERIAVEAGIEPRFVREAAARIANNPVIVRSSRATSPNAVTLILASVAVIMLQGFFVWFTLIDGALPAVTLLSSVLSVYLGLTARSFGRNGWLVALVPATATAIAVAALAMCESYALHVGRINLLWPLIVWQGVVALLGLGLSKIPFKIVGTPQPPVQS